MKVTSGLFTNCLHAGRSPVVNGYCFIGQTYNFIDFKLCVLWLVELEMRIFDVGINFNIVLDFPESRENKQQGIFNNRGYCTACYIGNI